MRSLPSFGPCVNAFIDDMVPIIERSGIYPTFMSASVTAAISDRIIGNVFRAGPLSDRMQGVAIANYIARNMWNLRVAIIHQADRYGTRASEAIVSRMNEENLSLVAHEEFGAYDSDFLPQLTRILQIDPDVLVVFGFAVPFLATITRQARQIGMRAKILGSNATSSVNYPKMVGTAGVGAVNIITLDVLPESDDPVAMAFRKKFTEKSTPITLNRVVRIWVISTYTPVHSRLSKA